MKRYVIFPFFLLCLNLVGQNSISDSLIKAQYSDAWWARTHGDFTKAKKILEILIKSDSINPRNYYEKANIYYLKKDVDSMSFCFLKALELGMDTMLVFEEFYSFYTFQIRNDNKRIEYVNKMIELQPENSEFYLKRRGVWIDMKNFDNSRRDLEKAASLGNKQAQKDLQEILEIKRKLKEKGIIK